MSKSSMDAAMNGRRAGYEWTRIVQQTAREISDDNCFGLAAQLAFYFLLSLFPFLLFLVALIGYLPINDALQSVLSTIGAVAPRELVVLLREQLDLITAGNHASLLTLGIAGAVWSSSAAMVAIIDALNRAYDLTEWRVWWKRRIVAVLLTIGLAIFAVVALALVLVGPSVVSRWAATLGFEPAVVYLWQVLRWPVMLFCVVTGVDLIYYFAPNRRSTWHWITPGSVLASALWLAASFGFKWYVASLGSYAATYGVIAGAVVTMLWLYLASLAILVGAELNGVLEQQWRLREAEANASAARRRISAS